MYTTDLCTLTFPLKQERLARTSQEFLLNFWLRMTVLQVRTDCPEQTCGTFRAWLFKTAIRSKHPPHTQRDRLWHHIHGQHRF